MLTLAFDQMIDSRGYPNLGRHTARPYTPEWRQFDRHWPFVVPLRLTMYLDHANVDYQSLPVDSVDQGWYPICISWFDFSIDYIDLIPDTTLKKIRDGRIRVMFYYHEGDNPQRIRDRLDQLCGLHDINCQKFLLISGNSSAAHIPNCVYFDDLECFLRYVNRDQHPDTDKIANPDREFEFTALSRNHKWWRATAMADLHRHGVLDRSMWSYRSDFSVQDTPKDNPISISEITGLEDYLTQFLSHGPYICDDVDTNKQIDFHEVNADLHYRSYWNIVTETHFDADQSGGTFLTEKTFKPIKYGQPFVLVGPPGSLEELRSRGYRVFDDVLDNSYDLISDNTQRWCAVRDVIIEIAARGPQSLWKSCSNDVLWNQELFASRREIAVNTLLKKLI
jgi:hypothetical protein